MFSIGFNRHDRTYLHVCADIYIYIYFIHMSVYVKRNTHMLTCACTYSHMCLHLNAAA